MHGGALGEALVGGDAVTRHVFDAVVADEGVRCGSECYARARVAEPERQVERLTEEKERALEVSAANAARVATLEQEVGSLAASACPSTPAFPIGLPPPLPPAAGLMRDGVRQLEDTRADAAKQRSDSTQLAEYQASCKSLKRDLVRPPPPPNSSLREGFAASSRRCPH